MAGEGHPGDAGFHPEECDLARSRRHRQNQATVDGEAFHSCPATAAAAREAHWDRLAAGAGDVTGAGRGSFRLRTSAVRLIWTRAERLIFHPSDLSGFTPQSDKSVSRETFWYD